MKKLGELLVQEGLVLPFHVERALSWQKDDGGRIGSLLIRLGYLDEREFLRLMGLQLRTRPVVLSDADLDPELVDLLPPEIARQANAVPIGVHLDRLIVATTDPHNARALREIASITGFQVEAWLAADPAIAAALDRYYPREPPLRASGVASRSSSVSEPRDGDSSASAEDLVHGWISEALSMGASQLTIQLTPVGLVVRTESVDGALELVRAAGSLYKEIMNRLRLAASLQAPVGAPCRESGMLRHDFEGEPLRLSLTLVPDVYGYAARIALDEARGRLTELGRHARLAGSRERLAG